MSTMVTIGVTIYSAILKAAGGGSGIPAGAITDPTGGAYITDPTGGDYIVDPNP